MIALKVVPCAEPSDTERCGSDPPSRSEDRSRDENFDTPANGFRKHRGKDGNDTNKHGRQRGQRQPFGAEA
jgi:hypothetical protein